MMLPLILRLDVTGRAMKWIPWQEAACLYARDMVAWTAGEQSFELHGGYSRLTGLQTSVAINSIIAVHGEYKPRKYKVAPPLNNTELFRRDHHTCLYCGRSFYDRDLTRDHVIPLSRGGLDRWSNVVAACKRCNSHKGSRTPEEAGMPLLAIPYVPDLAEYLVLRNRRILVDQMEFLQAQYKEVERFWRI